MRKVVISLGGSILVRGDHDPDYMKDLVKSLSEVDRDTRFIIVTGGGRLAREYISIGRECGIDESTLDIVGIQATRMNAWLVLASLKVEGVYPRPFTTLEEALVGASVNRFTIGGGTHPGHTTDAVSAMLGEMWGADLFLNLTAVDGAYTADPNRFEDAARLPRITSRELLDLVSDTRVGAGSHSVMDPLAAAVIHRAGIRTWILDGRDIPNLVRCLSGEEAHGTLVVHGE